MELKTYKDFVDFAPFASGIKEVCCVCDTIQYDEDTGRPYFLGLLKNCWLTATSVKTNSGNNNETEISYNLQVNHTYYFENVNFTLKENESIEDKIKFKIFTDFEEAYNYKSEEYKRLKPIIMKRIDLILDAIKSSRDEKADRLVK